VARSRLARSDRDRARRGERLRKRVCSSCSFWFAHRAAGRALRAGIEVADCAGMKKTLTFAWCLAAAGCGPQSPVDESLEGLTQKSGIDYSWARPSPSGIHGAGYSFVARYFDYSAGGGKILSKTEADSLIGAGLDIVITFEDGAQNALGGYNQ